MKTMKSIREVSPTRTNLIYRIAIWAAIFMVLIATSDSAMAGNLRVMGTGLGAGTITCPQATINCGATCDGAFTDGNVTLTATPDANSTFVRWEGDVTGTMNPITLPLSGSRSVRAVFDLTTPIPPLADFTPTGIQNYLTANPVVNTPARFVKALPVDYKRNWILMSRSESLQTGTAEFPRLLLPSETGQFTFTIGMAVHGSYPGSHPLAIEMMQWDPAAKNFRFHEIILGNIPAMGSVPARSRMVSVDDTKCSKCHSTQNVLNRSTFPGTTGIPPAVPPAEVVKSKNKPNWDTYDSWAGMLPLNRDRIYQGTVEAAAFRKIFNLWTWRANAPVREIIEQLELQPPGAPANHLITRTVGGANDGHVNFAFDAAPPVLIEPLPVGSDPAITTNYNFDGAPGSGAATSVQRSGNFVTLHHTFDPDNDEGRGVRFFDVLGGLGPDKFNQQRVADEVVSHKFATGSFPIDIRPVALGITNGSLTISGATVTSSAGALTIDFAFFNARNGMTVDLLRTETEARAFSMPRRKADIQKINLDRTGDVYLNAIAPANGLIQQYGAATTAGAVPSMAIIRQEVFRRPIDLGVGDRTVMGGIYVDRELASNINRVTLYRYFLEPLGVSVDKWSMGVRGRSRTYSFADVFGTYLDVIQPALISSLTMTPVIDPVTMAPLNPNAPAELLKAINITLATAKLPAVNDVPKYTDIQRIWNKSCIECHGGLGYPPYFDYGNFFDVSENENPPAGDDRLKRSYDMAINFTTADPATSYLYGRITETTEECPNGMMPCGGPALSKTDIETIRRWIVGPPSRPYTHGDPHIRTIDGVDYDFQAAGEYVLLKGDYVEVQARHSAVATNGPLGPNAYTGLTSCVSLNTAVAVKLGNERITYQPNLSGRPDPQGLQLRVNGKLAKMGVRGFPLASGGRIMHTSAPGGIQIEAQGGTVIVITPGWWEHYQVWYLNIDIRNVRATAGLMGAIQPGNWLPALPDGTLLGPRPADLGARYKVLYDVFGEAWRVTAATSLFDYAPGTGPETFYMNGWPYGESPQNCYLPAEPGEPQPMNGLSREEAEKLCTEVKDADRRAHCIEDLMATGESGFARTYVLTDRINRNTPPDAPIIVFPEDFAKELTLPVRFKWNPSVDKDGDTITYSHYIWPVTEAPNNNKAIAVPDAVPGEEGGGGMRCALIVGLIGLVVFLILYFLGMRRSKALTIVVALLILIAVILAYFLCEKRGAVSAPEVSFTVSNLEPGKAYFWKVIAEDGNGGVTESKTYRFEIK